NLKGDVSMRAIDSWVWRLGLLGGLAWISTGPAPADTTVAQMISERVMTVPLPYSTAHPSLFGSVLATGTADNLTNSMAITNQAKLVFTGPPSNPAVNKFMLTATSDTGTSLQGTRVQALAKIDPSNTTTVPPGNA